MFRGRSYDTFSEAYLAVLKDVYINGEDLKGVTKEEQLKICDNEKLFNNDNYYYNRGDCRELLNYNFTIMHPSLDEKLTTKSERYNKIMQDYADKETVLFDKGDIKNMNCISKVWETVANPDGTINANYGYMIYHIFDAKNDIHAPNDIALNQWEWAKQRLILHKPTLQAYLHFNRPKDQWKENLDQPCTMYIQFVIRENKLNLYGYMRSNDIVYGMPYNISYFIKLLYRMRDELLETYPNLTVGSYTHNVTGLHYYKRNEQRVIHMITDL